MNSLTTLLALMSFLLTVEHLAAQSSTALPIVSALRSLEGSGSTCPSDEARERVRNEIREEFYTTFEESIRPMFCGGSFGWRRVAFLNTSDPTEQCPTPWREINATNSLRLCGQRESNGPNCSSVMFSTSGAQYNSVCGRIIGYSFDSPDAFAGASGRTIDDPYVDGVSVTYGQPRRHIWSFAGGLDEDNTANAVSNCPCVNPDVTVPSYVGNNYFCETCNPGVWSGRTGMYHVNDPLWDGEGCGPNSQCCSFNSPPWFTAYLPSPTTEDIEVRICGNDGAGTAHEDTPIQVIELYVK